jgi:hypothetical protein
MLPGLAWRRKMRELMLEQHQIAMEWKLAGMWKMKRETLLRRMPLQTRLHAKATTEKSD